MIYRRDRDTPSRLLHEELTERVIGAGVEGAGVEGAGVEVHRALGPGLLESAYEQGLGHEFHLRGIRFDRQVPLAFEYQGIRLECGYRPDLLVDPWRNPQEGLVFPSVSAWKKGFVTKNGVANEN